MDGGEHIGVTQSNVHILEEDKIMVWWKHRFCNKYQPGWVIRKTINDIRKVDNLETIQGMKLYPEKVNVVHVTTLYKGTIVFHSDCRGLPYGKLTETVNSKSPYTMTNTLTVHYGNTAGKVAQTELKNLFIDDITVHILKLEELATDFVLQCTAEKHSTRNCVCIIKEKIPLVTRILNKAKLNQTRLMK